MSISFIASQVAVVLAYVFLALTYKTKSRKVLLFFNFGYLILSSVSYLFLSAYIGFAMTMVAILRNIIFLIQNKDKSSKYTFVDYLILILLVGLSIFLSFLTYNGFYSLFSMFSTVLYTFSVWQRSIPLYKILGIPVSGLYIGYFVFIGSIFGIICESIFFVFIVVENIIFFKNKSNSNTLDKNSDTKPQ